MLVKNIELTNFMSVDHVFLDLEKETYTIITGKNASGKSSLLEAIAMALTERRKGDSYRDYVQTGKKKAMIDMNVVLDGLPMRLVVEINTNKYGTPVARTIYYKDEIFKNSDCTNLLKSLNVKYLQHITFFHQKDSSVLNLKPAEISSLLKELFEIDYSTQANILSQGIITMEETDISLKSKLKTSEDFRSSLRTEELILIANEAYEESKKDLNEKESLLVKFADAKNKLKEIDNITENLQRAQSEVVMLGDRKLKYENALISDAKRMDVLIYETREAEDIAEDNTEDLALGVESLKHLEKEFSTSIRKDRDEVPSRKANIEKLQRELQAYENEVCPVCEHDLSSEHNKIPELQKSIKDCEYSLTELKRKISTASSFYNDQGKLLVIKTKELNDANDKITRAKLSIPKLIKENETVAKDLATRTSYLQDVENEITRQSLKVMEYTQELKTYNILEEDISSIGRLSDEIFIIKSNISRVERNIVINEERERGNKKTAKEQIRLQKEVDDTKSEINSLSKKVLSDKEALNILTTEFPNYVILQKTSQLEDSINDIIQKIFPGMTVKLILKRTGISFYYSPNSNEEYLPTKMASGAQSAILMLAWRVALAEMYGIDTLILDEIDADATDENSSIIYEFIGSLTTFDQILIISHRKEAIKTIKNINDSVQSYWVDGGIYIGDSPELNV